MQNSLAGGSGGRATVPQSGGLGGDAPPSQTYRNNPYPKTPHLSYLEQMF